MLSMTQFLSEAEDKEPEASTMAGTKVDAKKGKGPDGEDAVEGAYENDTDGSLKYSKKGSSSSEKTGAELQSAKVSTQKGKGPDGEDAVEGTYENDTDGSLKNKKTLKETLFHK